MNPPNKITLDVFGKILYALSMADGAVQQEEIEEMQKIVRDDKWAQDIKLSFDECKDLKMDAQLMFFKNMRIFQTLHHDEHTSYFLNLMERMAQSYGGTVPEERKLIQRFRKNLKTKSFKVSRRMPMTQVPNARL